MKTNMSRSLAIEYRKSSQQSIASARPGVGCVASGNLVESAERHTRQIRQAMKISKPEVFGSVVQDGGCFHTSMLPLIGNISSQSTAISEKSNLPENSQMDYLEIRRRNIATVSKDKKRFKTQRAFAAIVGAEPSHVNGWIKGSRDLGWPKAREIEEKIGLRPGWLDEETPLTDAAFDLAHRFMKLDSLGQAKLIARLAELEYLESLEKRSEELRLDDSETSLPVQEYKSR